MLLRGVHCLPVCGGREDFIDFLPGNQAQGVEGQVVQPVVFVHHQHDFVIGIRPASGKEFILVFQNRADHLPVHTGEHLGPQVHSAALGYGGSEGRRHGIPHFQHSRHIHAHILPDSLHQQLLGVGNQHFPVFRLGIHLQIQVIGVLDAGNGLAQRPIRVCLNGVMEVLVKGFQIIFRGFQVVQGVDHVKQPGLGIDPLLPGCRLILRAAPHEGLYEHSQIHRGGLQGQGVCGESVLLHAADIGVGTLGYGKNQGNADNADGTGKGGQRRASLLGKEVFERQKECRSKGHAGQLLSALLPDTLSGEGRQFLRGGRIGIMGHLTVQHIDNPGGILLGQLRIVGDHNHQPLLGNFFQNLHNLLAGFRIQGAGGFIRQNNLRVVHQGSGDGHPLHLSAGHLPGALPQLVSQTHLLQGLLGPAAPLLPGYTGQGQSQLHVLQHALVGNQVVALEHKAHGIVPVGIPVPVLEILGGLAPNHQVSLGIPVQAADNVQQGGLSAAGRPQYGHKFTFPELEADTPQGTDYMVPFFIIFPNIL